MRRIACNKAFPYSIGTVCRLAIAITIKWNDRIQNCFYDALHHVLLPWDGWGCHMHMDTHKNKQNDEQNMASEVEVLTREWSAFAMYIQLYVIHVLFHTIKGWFL